MQQTYVAKYGPIHVPSWEIAPRWHAISQATLAVSAATKAVASGSDQEAEAAGFFAANAAAKAFQADDAPDPDGVRSALLLIDRLLKT